MMFDDETLMAYADGELEAGRCREIEAALAGDPELGRRIEAHRRLRADVSGHYQSELEGTVPDGLMDLLQPAQAHVEAPGSVLPFAAAPANDRRAIWSNLAAIAASVLIGVLIGGQWPGRDAGDALLRSTPEGLMAAGQLEAALTRDVSGIAGSDGIRVMFTFASVNDGYCRSFTASGMAGIACRDDDVWQVRTTGSLPVAGGGEIRTAASALPLALLQEIDRMSAGDPLGPDGEAELIARGWRPAD
jgi:hypothetical protein